MLKINPPCQHDDFISNVEVSKVYQTTGAAPRLLGWELIMDVKCARCGVPFHFPGPVHTVDDKRTKMSVLMQPGAMDVKAN